MEKKLICLKTENSSDIKRNRESNFFSTIPNLKKRKSSINYAKLKFNQNVLVNILKKAHLNQYHKINTQSKNSPNIYSMNILNSNFKISYSLNKKFRNLPNLSNFHNITDEKINELIKSNGINEFKPLKSDKIVNIKAIFNHKKNSKVRNKYSNKINNTPLFKNNTISDEKLNKSIYKNNTLNNFIFNKTKKDLKRFTIGQKRILKLNEINLNFTNSLSYLKNKNEYNSCTDSNSKSKANQPKFSHHTISSSIKKVKLNKINSNLETKKWLDSIKDSIEKFDFFNRNSKLDRILFYMVKPNECFEENVLDIKPGDKYQLFKNQIAKHKSKLESIIKEMKLNQINNEYLMKKYIFDLLSRKKKVY